LLAKKTRVNFQWPLAAVLVNKHRVKNQWPLVQVLDLITKATVR
jgi:hypothetical protein